MSKKKGPPGRPHRTEKDKDLFFRRIESYLETGLAPYKACLKAGVSKSVVYDLMQEDPVFAEKVELARNHLSILLSHLFYKQIHTIAEKLEKGRPLNKEEMDFLKWFALNSKSTKEEFGERKELDVTIDPQVEIKRILDLIRESEGEQVPKDR